jgi:ABC-type uncharacterized transport system permease subunit
MNTELINCIIRQTNLTEQDAEKLLKENNNDVFKSIKQHYGIIEKKTSTQEKVSVNQQIYKEIRTLMDSASKTYREKKDETDKTNKAE